MSELADRWACEKVNDLYSIWKIPDDLWFQFRLSVGLFIAKAAGFEYTGDEDEMMRRLDSQRGNRANITPNGGVVPKKEYQLEYNMVLRSWCDICREMTSPNPDMLQTFRITPNIRIKFGTELEENVGRPLDTALPHSDAWVEGPLGMNCHVPIFGDVENNYLYFYKLRDESKFTDDFFSTAATYGEMKWVLEFYEPDLDLKPLKGHVNLSDYALVHKTFRNAACGTRVSIDTSLVLGDHEVHPDRGEEYVEYIPKIGEDMLVRCNVSVNDDIHEKQSTFSHYTTGALERIKI